MPDQMTPPDNIRQKETGVAKPVNIGSVTPDNVIRKQLVPASVEC